MECSSRKMMSQLWIPACHLHSKEESQQLCYKHGLLCWVVPLLCPTSPPGSAPSLVPPWAHPAPAKRCWSSASPAAHAEAREHCQNMRGGSGSFARLLGPFGNHHFPGNMFQMWSFRPCASSDSWGCWLPEAVGSSWCLADGTGSCVVGYGQSQLALVI